VAAAGVVDDLAAGRRVEHDVSHEVQAGDDGGAFGWRQAGNVSVACAPCSRPRPRRFVGPRSPRGPGRPRAGTGRRRADRPPASGMPRGHVPPPGCRAAR
jgi:hypothetical protein